MTRVFFCLWVVLSTHSLAIAGEHIYISGGPALRYFEKHKTASHDRFWGNFIQAAVARFQEWKTELDSADQFTWLIYRPSYISRGEEQGEDLITKTENWVAQTGAKIVWFDSRGELINYLNNGQDRDTLKIERIEYFGHSNKRNWMFDYSNRFDAAVLETDSLHMNQLKEINRRIFAKGAYCKSWGCHSGEEYSKMWRRATGVPLIGAIGKTDYSNASVPVISTPGGKWTK
ncbi:MAG: hypothetical protein AAFY98_03370 [Verrucomicrobiota bacterium]